MSRIGKRPIPIPNGVTVSIGEEAVEVKGPKGQLRQPLPPGVTVEISNGEVKAALARAVGARR
jgi:large subunit ribosomal protein L6